MTPRLPSRGPGQRIGLYGGSFDPAHAGHRHVSLMALRRLGLDRIWWLVTPGNPLKDRRGLPPAGQRLAAAAAVAAHPRIAVTAFEEAIGSRYTLETLIYLRRRCPGQAFVWIMGADSLAGFHRWRGWRRLAGLVPIAIVDRPGYTLRALRSPAALAMARFRVPGAEAAAISTHAAPAWVFLHGPRSPLSSSALRAAGRADPLASNTGRASRVDESQARPYLGQAPARRRRPEDKALTETLSPQALPSPPAPPAAADPRMVALACIEDMKAENTVEIDLVGRTSLADTMIITSGRSQRHVASIAERVLEGLKTGGFGSARVEGMPACDWVLIDAGDLLVHVFRPEVRGFYNLEKIWGADRPSEGAAV